MALGVVEKVKDLAKTLTPADDKKPAVPDPNQPAWVEQVAVLTGILAAVTGFLTVRATTLTNNAIYESNQAVLSQTQASDAWSEYQADSIKARLVEIQMLPSATFSAADKQKLSDDDKDLRDRQPKARDAAQSKERERDAHLANSQKNLNEKDLIGYSSMAAQLGIALASVAALTRRRAVFYIGIAVGVVSIIIAAYALASDYLLAH